MEKYLYEIDYVSFLIKNIKNPTFKKILDVHYYFDRSLYAETGTMILNGQYIKTDYTNLPCNHIVLDIITNMSFDEILKYDDYENCIGKPNQKAILEIIKDYENNNLYTSIKENYQVGDKINLLDIAHDGGASNTIIKFITEWK